jgi:dolichol-phosphate mannosyltransferase
MKIKKKEFIRFIKFGIVGVVGTGVTYLFWILLNVIFHVPDRLALGIAIEISIISNFILNNIWTFKDRKMKDKPIFRLLKFNFVSIGGLLLNIFIYTIFKNYLGFYKYFAEIFGILGGMFWNFFINNFWTWRKIK